VSHLTAGCNTRTTRTVASPARGHWGHVPPSTSNNFSFSSLFSKKRQPAIQVLCSLWDQLVVQMSTTYSSFDQYYISHKTISHRAAAAPSPEVCCECPMTKLTALPLLATNPGDATGPGHARINSNIVTSSMTQITFQHHHLNYLFMVVISKLHLRIMHPRQQCIA